MSTAHPNKRTQKAKQQLEDHYGEFDVWTGPTREKEFLDAVLQPLTEEQARIMEEFARQAQRGTVHITAPHDSL